MNTRTYGQFCGLARALEMIGERWSLLVVRDLVLGPKRFTELQRGLPKIPASILSSRLNELERSGVVHRRVLPELDAAVVYELTEYGGELDQIVLQLGLWGARSLNEKSTQGVFTLDSAILSLYTTFRPDEARGVQVAYELHYGDMIVHALVDDGALKVGEGPYSDADIVIVPKGQVMLKLLKGELNAAEAVGQGHIHIEGPAEHLHTFTRMFHVPAAPEPTDGFGIY
ncbi:winged helix-turn-helix transcriptional regulator [Amycolatopsis sp.]|jgi:DNA-binding HxlR family transcriptional regulator|uniref:winged helix-turn-helix transcriptional regulator n=1 Tax=Amycolatopsis sp. TaxID=37632 RepID=UPI002E0A848C|nr:winged helix-turn-helix transcriptional regulator [Amycolatopsis sp.]